jgi:hypothetical protein
VTRLRLDLPDREPPRQTGWLVISAGMRRNKVDSQPHLGFQTNGSL